MHFAFATRKTSRILLEQLVPIAVFTKTKAKSLISI